MAKIVEQLVLQDHFSATMGRYIQQMQYAATFTSRMAQAAGVASAAAGTLSSALVQQATVSSTAARAAGLQSTALAEMAAETDRAAEAADAATEALKRQERQAQSMGSAAQSLVDKLKGMATTYLSMKGVQMLVNAADQMSQINARLQLMTGSAEEAAAAQDKIFQAAQRSRGAYADMANMVSQLGMMAPDTFGDTDELIAFAEQVQKQLAIAGSNGAGAAAAITQLTQAMASGVLRGEELNSIFENATPIAQTIAEYMGITTGQLREMAAQGQVTADVVKNAMLSAAEETNAAFAQIPMTWSQVWTMAQNTALQALQPVLNGISWLANNLDTVIPYFAGAAAGLLAFAAASYVASGGLSKLLSSLTQINPIAVAIGIAVGMVVYHIAQWVQSVGGLKIAWLTAVDTVLTGMDNLKIWLTSGFYALGNALDQFNIKVASVTNSIADYFGDMKVNALTSIQDLANGAVDAINWMINQVNKIPGVAIDTIDRLTFAANAAAQNEAAKASRAADLAAMKAAAQNTAAQRAAALEDMQRQAYSNHMQRQVEIYNAKLDQAANAGNEDTGLGEIPGMSDLTDTVGSIGKDVGSIKKESSLTGEHLKSLVDVATGKYIQQVNLGGNTTVIQIQGQNTGKTKEDRQALADALKMVLAEQWAAGASRAMALPI